MEVARKVISESSAEEKRALLTRLLEKKARTPKRALLSLAQERLWFLHQLTPGNVAYNMFTAVRLKGDFDVTALEKSFNEIIRRHEILRTSFSSIDGAPAQIIEPAVTLTLPLVDLSHLPEAQREAEVQSLAAEEAHRPFVLTEAPLLRASVLRLGDRDHVVLVNMDHIVSDGWSLSIFTRELSILYEAFRTGQASPLPELPLQYSDFAQWQRQWLSGEQLESRLSYWKDKLEGIPPLLELPTDYPRPLMQSFRGVSRGFRISRDLWAALKDLNRREAVTMFMTLLAAFQTLLYRYTAQDDIIIGTPMAGRERLETQSLIGFFLNTLVIRARFTDGLTFREVLRQTRESVLEAHENQDLPFEKLVEALRPERSLSYEPIVQVAFVFVVTSEVQGGEKAAELKVEGLSTRNDTTKYDLTLYIQQTADDEYLLDIQYSSDLFDDATINRMFRHYEVILREIVRNAEQPVSKLPLLLDSEREQLLTEWNDTRKVYPSDQCLHELFQQQAARIPNAPALICGSEQLTYEELNARANRLAHKLRALGVGPESVVGVLLERSTSLIVALLGVLKSGASYVPLDPAYPSERLRFMLEDAGATVLLTQHNLRDKLSPHDARVVCLDIEWEDIAAESDENPVRQTAPANLAYVIYTSGSTGKPKGAAIEHHSAVTMVQWARDFFTEEQLSGVLASTSVCFDLSVFEIFVPLTSGGKVILAPNALELPNLEAAGEVTLINTVPSAMAELVHMDGVPDSVQVVNLAGEPLQKVLVERIYELNTVDQVVNLYGPSEDTTYSTWARIEKGDSRAPTIGRPIANTQVYVLDAQQQPVPLGAAGELYLSGDGVARGYLNRPELTAEKFVPNPFASEPGTRMYRTGDLVRYLADGRLEFTGRCDQQVKIRGFRIEPGEVEALLAQQAGVNMTAVMVHTQANGDKRLVAYVTAMPGRELSAEDLRRGLKEQLPEYMVPSTFVMLEQMPLTPNGKINRRALPAPNDDADRAASYVAPRNALESQLVRIWEDLLPKRPIGVTESFFKLGGHSLLAVRLMVRIKKEFGQDLPVSTLFAGETVERLARIVSEQSNAWRWASLVPIQPQGLKPAFYCVHALGGNVNTYYLLARYLGDDQPFYGLQAPPLHDVTEEDSNIELMAARYVKAIREVQPVGPYRVGGFSFGCFVAYEMARQFRELGEEVALLALFDAYSPVYLSKVPEIRDTADLLRSLAWVTSRERGKRLLLSLDTLRQLNFDEQLDYFLEKMREEDLAPPEVDHELLRRFLQGSAARQRAARNYVPQKYPGSITIFKCEERDPLWVERLSAVGLPPDDHTLGWGELSTEPATVIEVPGHHDVMCNEPFVQTLAQKLAACLAASVEQKSLARASE